MSREIHVPDYINDIVYATDAIGTALFNYTQADIWHPIDVAFDSSGNIYVVDNGVALSGAYPIWKFDPQGTFVTGIGTTGGGSANGQCSYPTGMCFDSAGNMYIVDAGNDRVQKWDSSGSYVTKWGTTGTGNGQFDLNGGANFAYIACDQNDELYVGDCGNNRVQVFNTSGTYQRKWGSSGTGNSQFTTLNGIAVAPDGTIYVVDDYWNTGSGNNSRVQHFSNTGTYLDEYDSPGYSATDGCFEHPNDIGIDADGNIYVVDEYNDRVQKFDSSWTYLTKWTVTNPQGIGVRGSDATPFVPQIYRRR